MHSGTRLGVLGCILVFCHVPRLRQASLGACHLIVKLPALCTRPLAPIGSAWQAAAQCSRRRDPDRGRRSPRRRRRRKRPSPAPPPWRFRIQTKHRQSAVIYLGCPMTYVPTSHGQGGCCPLGVPSDRNCSHCSPITHRRVQEGDVRWLWSAARPTRGTTSALVGCRTMRGSR